MCVFSIGGHTVGPTVLKFGMEDHIYPGEVLGYISFWHPDPLGQRGGVLEVHAALTVHFWENFSKQKLKGTPALVRSGPDDEIAPGKAGHPC